MGWGHSKIQVQKKPIEKEISTEDQDNSMTNSGKREVNHAIERKVLFK
jgi:hypothetical protein